MKLFSKFLIVITLLMTVAVVRIGTSAQEVKTIDPQIIKFNDYYRFSFKSDEYLPFDLIVDGNNVIIDFEKVNNLDLSNFIYPNSIIKSFGSSGDGKSYIIKVNADGAKIRKFISDNNTVGFDLYLSDKASEKQVVVMSGTPEEQAQQIAQGDFIGPMPFIAAEKEKVKEKERKNFAQTEIITFPKEFIGPPKAEQLFENPDSFVGPFAFDTNKYSVYEIMKTAAKGAIIPDIAVNEDGFILSFPLNDIDSVSAAAIARGDKINILFNSINTIQLGELLQNPFIKSIKNIPNDKYRIVEIDLNQKKLSKDLYNKAFYKDKFSWIFELYKQDAENKFDITPLSIGAEDNFGEKRIVAQAKDIVGPAEFVDEKTGETIKAFLVKDNAFGVTLPREYVDLKFLPSLQGIFIKEKSDYLTYDTKNNKLLVTKLSNLDISDDIIAADLGESKAAQLAQAKIKGVYPENSILPFQIVLDIKNNVKKEKKAKELTEEEAEVAAKEEEAKKTETASNEAKPEGAEGGDDALNLDTEDQEMEAELKLSLIEEETDKDFESKDFTQTALEYTKKVLDAPKEKQSDLKLNLADLYFSKGFYVEALGVLQDIKISDPAYKDMFKVNVQLAAAQFLTEKYLESFDGFSEAIKTADRDKNYSEIKLWQWAAEDMYKLKTRYNNDAPIDIDFTASYDKFMQQYPTDIRYRLGLMFIDQKLKAGKADEANSILDIISYNGIPKKYANDTLFVKAQIADKTNKANLSKKIYEKLTKDVDDRKNRARAIFETTKNQLLKNEISSADAIAKFLDATTIWRDDYFEMDVLEIVGHLYVAQKDYNNALNSWKQIANNFPETAESVFILGKMRQLFVDLFDGDIAYKLKPLDTLKLYFGFRELTPAGPVGDKITRKVAQFFISADMMDEAIKIVEHQIKYRSAGDEKAKLALWLYKINIDNRDLDGAESALNLLQDNEASPLLVKQKKYSQTMITALRGNYQEALDAIKGDFSSDANKIRTELFWQKENWFGVISMVEARLNDIRETKPLPLTKPEMNDINRLMVAYSAQGDNKKLVTIRNEFYNRIPDNDDQLLFDYLTAGSRPVDYNDFENSVELGQIERFLNDYTFMPTQSWDSSVKVLEPKVAKLMGKPIDDMTRGEKLDVVKLAISYSMLMSDEKLASDMKKKIALLSRDFKDIKVDRVTIDAFNIFDDKFMPKENDAVFEGKIRLSDIPAFVDYYKKVNKFSELNISIRDKFKN